MAKDFFEVRVEKVHNGDGHRIDFEWEFITEHGTRLDFVCPTKDFYYRDEPHIKFFGNQNQYIGVFKLEANNKCNELNEILRGIHYQVDPVHPIIIQFNRKQKKVETITLPDLDPYELKRYDNNLLEKSIEQMSE